MARWRGTMMVLINRKRSRMMCANGDTEAAIPNGKMNAEAETGSNQKSGLGWPLPIYNVLFHWFILMSNT